MKVFVFLCLALAACSPTKRLSEGPVILQSSLVTHRQGPVMVNARAMALASGSGMDYVLHLAVADDASLSDITLAYAFDTPMPFVPETSNSGYITMSKEIFGALSQTGFDVVLIGGTKVYPIFVPGSYFAEVLAPRSGT